MFRLPLLLLLTLVIWVPLLFGRFVYDDVEYVANHSALSEVHTFSDCFRYSGQPTRPIANFFLAMGQWWGEGNPLAQKELSLFGHLLVVLMVFLTLRVFAVRFLPKFTESHVFWTALLFAWLPIHSETLSVAQFRGEILGSLFALCALRADLWEAKIAWKKNLAILLAYALASLSKEIFFFIVPLLLVANRRKASAFWMPIALLPFFIFTVPQDSFSNFSSTLGWSVLPPKAHGMSVGRALLEGFPLIFLGRGISTLRLNDRMGPGALWSFQSHLIWIFSLCAAFFYFAQRSSRLRPGIVFFSICAIPYLLIPNLNIGSTHYWYLPSLGLLFAVVAFLPWNPVTLLPYAVFLSALSQLSLADFRDRERLALHEAQAHAESAMAWLELASVYLSNPTKVGSVRPLLEKAKSLKPHRPELYWLEFHLDLKQGLVAEAREALLKLEGLSFPADRLARCHYDLAVRNALENHREEAAQSLERALKLDPKSREIQELSRSFGRRSKSS